jgi:hypothetical protein
MQSAWSSRRPRVALLPNEAAARPPAAMVEQVISPRVSRIGMHPWSESSYTTSTATELGSAHLPGAASAQPLSHRLESSSAQQLLQQGTARLRL